MFTLAHHPAQSPAMPMTVSADVAVQSDDTVVFSFCCRYQADERRLIDLMLPEPTVPTESDNLWQHTCCEAFVSVPDTDDYLEFNFSPSGCWAMYRFNGYRVRDEAFRCSAAPKIELKLHEQSFELTATVSSTVFRSQWPQHTVWQIGLTAVIETNDGHKSYWALRHDGDQPDFHLRTQFLLPLHNQKTL